MLKLKLFIITAAFLAGWQINGWRLSANLEQISQQQAVAVEALAVQLAETEQALNLANNQKIKKVVTYAARNPTDCVLSADGLQLWRDANAARTDDATLPTAATTR